MKYSKPARHYPELTRLLLDRGMNGDPREVEAYLQRVSYYRLSGYWHPFRRSDQNGDDGHRLDEFVAGTQFRDIVERYEFDAELRSIVFKKVGTFEIAFRTALAHEHSMRHGPFGYVENPACMPGLTAEGHASILATVQRERSRSSVEFVRHFDAKYGEDHWYMPVWMAAELMSFGTVLTWYRKSHQDIRRAVAMKFGIHDNILVSWVRAIHAVRNVCAHHGRLWNRVLGVKPMIPRDPTWHSPIQVENDRVFSVLTILAYLSEDETSLNAWRTDVESLLGRYSGIPQDRMGFPIEWKRSSLWKWAVPS